MPLSEKIGSLSWLSFVWDHGPVTAALIVFAIDFGAICLLMCLEGMAPQNRTLYKAMLLGDSIFLPLYAAAVVMILEGSSELSGFYTASWWHWSLLLLGFIVSIAMEVGAVKGGQYTMSQELSPSKLWHTFIFGIIFYWLASTIIPVVVVHRSAGGMLLLVISIVGFVYANCLDWKAGLVLESMHLEGSYVPWEWHVRKK